MDGSYFCSVSSGLPDARPAYEHTVPFVPAWICKWIYEVRTNNEEARILIHSQSPSHLPETSMFPPTIC